MAALSRALGELNREGLLWCAGASFLLFSHGLLEKFGDLDLIVAEGDIARAEGILDRAGAKLRPGEPHPCFASRRFLKGCLDGLEIDLICGMRILRGEFSCRYILDSAAIAGEARLAGERVPLAAPEDWLVLYRMMPGRTARADLVAAWLKERGAGRPGLLRRALLQPLPPALKQEIRSLLGEGTA